jgi:hypothetical protein
MRLLGAELQLWDVRNVEAHVRGALDAGLAAKGARLNAAQYDRCLQFLRQKCWELSGLQADAKTLRYVWEIRGFIKPAGKLDPYEPLKVPQFGSQRSAEIALDSIRDDLRAHNRTLSWVSIHRVRPRGAYDPARGIKFTTYSWRLLSDQRIDDWYRSDPEFGDTRYESNRVTNESLEGLAHRLNDDGDEVGGELPVPLGRLEVIDELNKHQYQDASEEVLTREAFGF